MDTLMSGFKIKCAPLISFYTIVDVDLGVCNLALSEYNNKGIFDISDISDDYYKMIDRIYHREQANPLKSIIKNEYFDNLKKDENSWVEFSKFLDECYLDFLTGKEKEVLDLGVITDVAALCKIYHTSTDIRPTILCYSDLQVSTIKEIRALNGIPIVLIDEIKDADSYSQLFLYSIEEAERFAHWKNKTFYFANTTRNMKILDNRNTITNDIVETILSNENMISVFDMYKSEIFKKKEN